MAKPDKKLSRTEPATTPVSAAPAGTPTAASAQEAPSPVSAPTSAAPGESPVVAKAVGAQSKPSPLVVPVRNIFGQLVKPVTGGIGSGSAK